MHPLSRKIERKKKGFGIDWHCLSLKSRPRLEPCKRYQGEKVKKL